MRNIFYLSILLIGFSSCSPQLTPFTERLVKENRWSEDQIRRIQFYLSEDILLSRRLGGSASTIEGGEIKVINGRKVEQVVIAKGTPGVVLFSPKSDRLAVSFESGGDDRYLMFGPNSKVGGRFVLLAKEWDRRSGQVTYEDKLYRVEGKSAYASLMVDLKKINKTVVNSRKAGGRTVGR
ncbi:MAG: hypothetical protein AAF242_14625 [Bacteroidota bacterium]